MALPIPSETWGSLLEIGLTQYLAKKIRESRQGEDEEPPVVSIEGLGTVALLGQAQNISIFNNISQFSTNYSQSQSNYLMNPSIINSFIYGDGAGGIGGDASFAGGYGAIGTSEGSPFGSVSTFGQDTADKIGKALGFAMTMAMVAIAKGAIGVTGGPFGTLALKAMEYFAEKTLYAAAMESLGSGTGASSDPSSSTSTPGSSNDYGMSVSVAGFGTVNSDGSFSNDTSSPDTGSTSGVGGDTGVSGHDGGPDGANE